VQSDLRTAKNFIDGYIEYRKILNKHTVSKAQQVAMIKKKIADLNSQLIDLE
jgi:hypothetical protein